ncbi:uncharacterized protein B0J16DRAFT_323415 [Fusarium flagelliforme]|uniref:uncharacterized protein n=1 Tax=Fusarium flagelliforme TaxID=2675880 RepID=UPI001E8EF0D7|nr:uncharacterized protein B0J16DRAFT_323415 [Fusarium flagelliforme]KAH7179947.1 hypothetical protein B0J16DRAFT_323415 [Fusarium flagelliforme]
MLALVELLGSSIDGGGIFCTPFRDTAPSILIRNSECSQQVSLCYVAIGILQSLDCSSIPDDRHYADPDYAVEERWQISQGIINRIRKRDATFQLQNIHASYLLLLPLHHIKNGGSFDTDVITDCTWRRALGDESDRWVRSINGSCVVYIFHSFIHAVLRGKRILIEGNAEDLRSDERVSVKRIGIESYRNVKWDSRARYIANSTIIPPQRDSQQFYRTRKAACRRQKVSHQDLCLIGLRRQLVPTRHVQIA